MTMSAAPGRIASAGTRPLASAENMTSSTTGPLLSMTMTTSAFSQAADGVSAIDTPYCVSAVRLGAVAIPHRGRKARLRQPAGHVRAHDAGADERDGGAAHEHQLATAFFTAASCLNSGDFL